MIVLLALAGAAAAIVALALRNELGFQQMWRDFAAGRPTRAAREQLRRMRRAIR